MSDKLEVVRVEIAKLQLQPGDILVIKVGGAHVGLLDGEQIGQFLPNDVALLILPLETQLETIHGELVDAADTHQP